MWKWRYWRAISKAALSGFYPKASGFAGGYLLLRSFPGATAVGRAPRSPSDRGWTWGLSDRDGGASRRVVEAGPGYAMWTPTTRRRHSRTGLRYETNLTDAEWAVIRPLMPKPASCGRPLAWTMREVLNAIFHVRRGGIAWRLIPKDLPPRSTHVRLRQPLARRGPVRAHQPPSADGRSRTI